MAAALFGSSADVVVVGASNMDLTSYVPRLPQPGETLHGHEFKTGYGGKGANQCVMAGKLGASVSMVAKVGHDTFGADMIDNFKAVGVDVTHVTTTKEASSGVAPIAVDDKGQNSIIICNGANDYLTEADVAAADDVIAKAKVVITQNEIKPATTLAALRAAAKHGVTSIFNFAPATKETIDPDFFSLPTIFCANETETAMATGLTVTNMEEGKKAAKCLHEKHKVNAVLLTLGEHGALLSTEGGAKQDVIPAAKVEAKDTSGAGDAFLGAFGFYLARFPDLSWAEMARRACVIATATVALPGTQSSYPAREALPGELF